MPQLAVAAAGAYLGGAAFGTGIVALGMTGAQLGLAAGSLIGGMLFAPTVQSTGPRLADLKAPAISYGSVLPYVEGHPFMPLIPIWQSELREVPNTTESGGKGGGGAEQTTFTYECDALFKVSGNTCWAFLRRLKKNGALVWTQADDADADSIDATAASEFCEEVIFYDGNGAQLPDPTYEAAKGVGLVPAYRGCMTVMLKGIKLGTTKQLPIFSAEGAPASDTPLFDCRRILHDFALTDYAFAAPKGAAVVDGDVKVWGIRSGDVIVYTAGSADPYTVGATTTDTIPAGAAIDAPGQMNGDRPLALFGGVTGHFYLAGDGVAHDYTITGTPAVGTSDLRGSTWNGKVAVATAAGSSDIYLHDLSGSAIGAATHGHAVSSLALTASTIFALSGSTVYPYDATTFAAGATFALPAGTGHRIFTTMQGALACANVEQQVFVWSGTAWEALAQLQASDGADLGTTECIHVVDGITVYAIRTYDNPDPITRVLTTYDQAVSPPFAYDGLAANTVINTLTFNPPAANLAGWTDIKGYAVGWTWDDRGSIGGNYRTIEPTWPGHINVTTYAGGTAEPNQIHTGSTGTLTVITINEDVPLCGFSGTVRWTGQAPPSGFQEQYHDVYKTAGELVPLGEPTLQEVVEHWWVRGGCDLANIDASALATRNVHAMPITTFMSARQVIDMLKMVYGFYSRRSGLVTIFDWRGQASVATVPYEDLLVDGEQDVLPIALPNDLELPVQGYIKYFNLNDNFQDGSESYDREVSSGQNSMQIEVPLGLTPDEAKRVIDFNVNDAVASATRYGPFRLSRAYWWLEPGDVVNLVNYDGSLHRVRVQEITDSGGMRVVKACSDDAGVLDVRTRTDTTGYTNSTVVAAPVETSLVLLDIPILDDADDAVVGFYAGVKPTTDVSFVGAMLFKSSDDVTFEAVGSSTVAATFGTAGTALPSGPVGVFDEAGLITVDVGFGELSSVTREVLLANPRVNLLLAGSEIIQFRDAALLSPGVYTLSGLLRGRRGTEWAVGTHAVDEQVVLLNTAIKRVPISNSDLGVAKYYKAVTMGRSGDTATSQAFTCNGIGEKPFSPVDLRVARDSSSNATITFKRRTRLATRFCGSLGISVPLGEDAESYVLEIWNSTYTTLKRTITANTSADGLVSFAYSAANQTTDFGSTQSTIYARGYQVSAQVGRGTKLQAQG